MATILQLPYTLAIAPDSRGGFLYGLPHDCQVSADPGVLEESMEMLGLGRFRQFLDLQIGIPAFEQEA
jgi:hypothetical protein